MKQMLYFALLVFLMSNCHQTIAIVDDDLDKIDTSGLQVIWANNLSQSYSIDELTTADHSVVVSYRDNPETAFEVFDKSNGSSLMKISPTGQNQSFSTNFTVVDNSIIANTNRGFYCLDLESNREKWGFETEGNTQISWQIHELSLFMEETSPNKTYYDRSTIKMVDIRDGSVKEVLSINLVDVEATPILAGFGVWTHPHTDDRILMFTLSNIPNSDHADLRKSIRAYNLTKDEYLWIGEPFGTRATNESKIIIDGNVMYQPSDNSVYKFDCFTGELLWDCELDDEFNTSTVNLTDLHIDDDAVYANSDDFGFYKIDKETGQIIWERNIAANCSETILERDGILYLSCWGEGDVLGIDKMTGDIKYRLDTGNAGTDFHRNNVEYDEKLDLFYTMDLKGPVCFKLNE